MSVVDSEKKRSDEYWMGVRDALRMVDSFSKWARRNKERAKDMDDFIHEGLIAAAKRCESCLKDDLGLTFHEDIDSPVPRGYESTPPVSEDNESFDNVILQQTDDDISIESVGRLHDEEMDDLALDGPPREFSSDFELVEPTPLGVESPALEEDEPEEDILFEEESEGEKKPSFTWADYEEAVSPVKEEPMIDEEDFEEALELVSELDDSLKEEPALPTDEFDSLSEEVDSPPIEGGEIEETDLPEPITEPPPPPPPPESEEDEDERRRRARRLFFGD